MKPRRPIARVGRKAKRERGALTRCRKAVQQRSGGYCEATGLIDPICGYTPHAGTAMHHMWPEDRDAGRHDPERCRWLCTASHQWVHAHPNKAKELGLLRPDPLVVLAAEIARHRSMTLEEATEAIRATRGTRKSRPTSGDSGETA